MLIEDNSLIIVMVLFLLIPIIFSLKVSAQKVNLREGIFQESQQLGKEYLLDLNVDRLLAPYYEAVDLKAKADTYGGWEAREISGHSLGHWLSASSQMYKETNDQKLSKKINYVVDELHKIQKQRNDGYIGGVPPEIFEEVFSGDFQVDNFSLADYWVPWYNLHKTYAGLIDTYKYTDNKKALKIVTALADWAKAGTDNLDDKDFKRMLIAEYGGMGSALIDLYKITDNKEYFELALRFNEDNILDPLKEENDNLTGKHANTQIPKVISAAKTYEINHEDEYKTIADFFWKQVIDKRSYVFGGNSRDEHFDPVHTEKLSVTSAETCNTYNMMELAEHLYSWSLDPEYMNYYENALYNHILASQDPESGMKTYFMSTEPGHFKVYSTPEDSFWCCVGTGMENPARYTRSIYHQTGNELYVNLFISSTYSDKEMGYELSQETKFPNEEKTKIKFDKVSNNNLELNIRIPDWIDDKMVVYINNEKQVLNSEAGYITLDREWEKNDVVEIEIPMGLNFYESMDDENKVAVKYGPIVLAAELGRKNYPENDNVGDHLIFNNYSGIEVPKIISDQENVNNIVEISDREELKFNIPQKYLTGDKNVTLIPLYNLHHQRYTVYWNKYSEEEYQKIKNSEQNREEKIENITLDVVKPNQQQSEIEHNLKTKNSASDYFAGAGEGWRDAKDGGFFSYELKVDEQNEDLYLMVDYWGNDGPIPIEGEDFTREFKIAVEDEIIAKERLNHNQPDEIFSVFYKIPSKLIEDKEVVEVKFISSTKTIAGGVFGLRITKDKL